MSAKNYAVLEADGTVWGVIVCEPSQIRRHVQALGLNAYIRRPDENLSGKLKMLEPGAVVSGGNKAGKKYKNPTDVTIRGQSTAVAPVELPGDLPEEE